ncbi:MAG TPA: CO dehydrogenase/CO-methylating acetyl-CoA synthase complex subunit beta, partial [Candidatus Heimdallarchaeota archaeon]|nr:CO dehydrogenase/CO-methylating acetyl-CoA synthase complex subunit beta [Candidatus Heimdallarchaeota archaeon]
MSRIIATAAIRGAHGYVQQAKQQLTEAIEAFGPDKKIEFPNTAYFLPLILALTGREVKSLADAEKSLEQAESLLPPIPTDRMWLPYLGHALDAGVATLIAQEIIEVLKYVNGVEPEEP